MNKHRRNPPPNEELELRIKNGGKLVEKVKFNTIKKLSDYVAKKLKGGKK